jgi:hypothetical protein
MTRAGGVAQMVECRPSKDEALSSNPIVINKVEPHFVTIKDVNAQLGSQQPCPNLPVLISLERKTVTNLVPCMRQGPGMSQQMLSPWRPEVTSWLSGNTTLDAVETSGAIFKEKTSNPPFLGQGQNVISPVESAQFFNILFVWFWQYWGLNSGLCTC